MMSKNRPFDTLQRRLTLLLIIICFGAASAVGQSLPSPTGTKAKPTSPPPAPVLWEDRWNIASLDMIGGAGGRELAPKPPFTFVEENLKGSNPKIKVTDASGVEWSVKWGTEVNAETFATRMIWAVGYFVEPAYFVPSGKIDGVTGLQRAKEVIKPDGSFANARFERQREKGIKKLDEEKSWSWIENPFVGKPELNGLRVMVMLLSNWDNKDLRDVKRGSNTAIFQTRDASQYLITDWGGSMGKWGGFLSREKWDCKGYSGQTKSFVKGVKGGSVEFGYTGQHTSDFVKDIKVADVQWLMKSLGQITDEQLRQALEASGATAEEQACFTKAVRERIDQLKNVK
jgi:hypothetical protein